MDRRFASGTGMRSAGPRSAPGLLPRVFSPRFHSDRNCRRFCGLRPLRSVGGPSVRCEGRSTDSRTKYAVSVDVMKRRRRRSLRFDEDAEGSGQGGGCGRDAKQGNSSGPSSYGQALWRRRNGRSCPARWRPARRMLRASRNSVISVRAADNAEIRPGRRTAPTHLPLYSEG